LGLVDPVPRAPAAQVLLDGRAVGPETAAAERVAFELKRSGDREWIVLRNLGDRPRVIEQVSFEHRFIGAPQGQGTGDGGLRTGDEGRGAGDGGLGPPHVILHGPRAFIRGPSGGYSAALDAPVSGAETFPGGVRFWYNPYHRLDPGAVHVSHDLVSVPTGRTGFRLAPAQGTCYTRRHAIGPWALSAEPLDLGEIRAVQDAVAREAPPRDGPLLIHDGRLGGGSLERSPDRVLRDLSLAADLGLDYHLPDGDLGAWTAGAPSPETLDRVFAHAGACRVRLGLRLCANAPSCGSGQPWRPDRPEWAILQADGKPHPARCLGNPEFADWLSEEIGRRLAAHPFRLVAFDCLAVIPCHADGHGHPPGEASLYAQARGAESLLRRLKERHPGVATLTRRGWDAYIPRFARWTDLHDAGGGDLLPFPEVSLTRLLNDALRKERLLVHHFRFLPLAALSGTALFQGDATEQAAVDGLTVTRPRPGVRPPAPASGVLGFTLLQSLATGPNLTLAGLHAWVGEEARAVRSAAEIDADREFLRTWIHFARANAGLLRTARFLTPPDVDVHHVEVYGRLARAEAVVFVVNPDPREARVRLETDGTAVWTCLYPATAPGAPSPITPRATGDALDIAVPPWSAAVVRGLRRGTEDLRTLRAASLSPRRQGPSPLFREIPIDVDAWAGGCFPALPDRPIAWKRTDTGRGFAVEGTVVLAGPDLSGDLALALHPLQPERAEPPRVTLNGAPLPAGPVLLRAPEGRTPGLPGGYVVPSAEVVRAAVAGENRLRVEIAHRREAPESEWQPLFNGRDLEGWDVFGSAVWRVEDGAMVGTQDGDPKKSGLLATRGQWQDFELALEFQIDAFRSYNSGVYLRNDPGTQSRTGYQVNIGSGSFGEYSGGIYLKDWKAKGDEHDAILRKGEWNALRILAEGPRIAVDLNGVRVADYTDPAPDPKHLQRGVLALQTYGAEGHAGWVRFRDIRLRNLK
jgi:hypothetical protein